LRLKRLPAAAAAAEVLLKIDPQNIPARNVLASVYLVGGQLDEAIAILKEALQIKVTDRVENIQQTRLLPNFLLGKAYQLKDEQAKAGGK
jgi:predicted Zn-dependent protease